MLKVLRRSASLTRSIYAVVMRVTEVDFRRFLS